jgi:alpha-L-fucosidase
VELLGSRQRLKWEQGQEGLRVQLPAEKPCDYAFALKIAPVAGHGN